MSDENTSGNCTMVDSRHETSLDVPLFLGSKIPSPHFNIALISFVQRHNLSYACETDLLHLLAMVLPSPNEVLPLSFLFTSQFANLKSDSVIQHFCDVCSQPIDPGLLHTRPLCCSSQGGQSVFIRIPVAAQLIECFQGKLACVFGILLEIQMLLHILIILHLPYLTGVSFTDYA